MTEPKRRGRPPGSKNKPKFEAARDAFRATTADMSEEEQTSNIRSIVDVVRHAPSDPEPLMEIGETTIRVILQRNRHAGERGPEIEVEWPSSWPIPRREEIVIHEQISGHVQWTEYDLVRGIVKIDLR